MRNETVIPPADELIREYCRDLMEKVFYFCLKKTGDTSSAEELCSDVSLAVISALKRGAVPENFAAWVWQVARNRHADFAEKRRIRRDRTSGADISDFELSDGSSPPIEDIIRDEDLKLLRRELAFISEEYRSVVVAFYIEDRSIKDISRSLNLPEGTVKSKLHRARNILKEGMNMAREFGPKSYKPENVHFIANGNQPSGLPWKAVERSVQRNILLEAADNPSTVEELSIALGIAVPYMQDEVDILVKATLMKKIGDKYVANIPFVSKEAQKRIYELKIAFADEMADIADKIADDAIPKIRELGAVRSDKITDADIKWWATCYCLYCSEGNWVRESGHHEYAVRENGETWEFYGFEDVDFYDPFVSFNGNGFAGYNNFAVFVPHEYHIAESWCNFGPAHAVGLIGEAISKERKYDDLTEQEKSQLESAKKIARVESDGSIVPNILCFDYENSNPRAVFTEHPLFEKLREIDRKLYADIVEILKSEQNSYVQNQIYGVAGTMNHMRGLILRKEVNDGKLIVPEDPWNSTCTAMLWIF